MSKIAFYAFKQGLRAWTKGKRVIGCDNSEGKGDHRHYRGKEESYHCKGLRKLTIDDFYRDIERYKEGKF